MSLSLSFIPDKHIDLHVNEALLYYCTEFTIAGAKVYDFNIFLPNWFRIKQTM